MYHVCNARLCGNAIVSLIGHHVIMCLISQVKREKTSENLSDRCKVTA